MATADNETENQDEFIDYLQDRNFILDSIERVTECVRNLREDVKDLKEKNKTLESYNRILRAARVKADEDIACLQNQISGQNEILWMHDARIDRISRPTLNSQETLTGLRAHQGYLQSNSSSSSSSSLEERLLELEDNRPVTLTTQERVIIDATIALFHRYNTKKLFQSDITKNLTEKGHLLEKKEKYARKLVNVALKKAAKAGELSLEYNSRKKVLVRLNLKEAKR